MSKLFINKEEIATKKDIPNLFDWSKAKQVDSTYDLDTRYDPQVLFWGTQPKGLPDNFVPYGIVLSIRLLGAGKIQFALDTNSHLVFRIFGGTPTKWSSWRQIGGVARYLYTYLSNALVISNKEVA